jgi:hypothetical protein
VANSVYQKTSDVAQLDIYSGARDNYPPAGASGGNFVVPDGTQLVVVLERREIPNDERDKDQHRAQLQLAADDTRREYVAGNLKRRPRLRLSSPGERNI